YRPHIKTHKSINIAKKQIEAGAIGITVATVGEAEIMSEGGIKDILIAFPVAIKEKLDRIEKLLNQSKITVAVDSISQANILNDWIKVNSGLNRAGVEPNHEVKDLANVIKDSFYLSLDGIFTHAGHSYAAQSETEIKQIAQKEAEVVLESVKICESIGIDIPN